MANNVLMVGLPESGKTTYLAAFWHLLEKEFIQDGRLQMTKMPDEIDYLSSISDAWARCEQMPRTRSEQRFDVTISLKSSITNVEFDLLIPDLSERRTEIFGLKDISRKT